MKDIVERLRWSGQDAMTKHLSLGMAKLHAEAADEIERIRKDARAYANVELSEENDRLIEEVALWKSRYAAAEQALDATVKDFNKFVSDGP